MAHLPRFHRRKKDVAAPTLITSDLPAKATPPSSSDPQSAASTRSLQRLSPFRVFHRSSGKRARDSPPASLPHSPAAASAAAGDCADDRPVSPLSLKTDPAGDEGQKAPRPPKMPAFLEQSPQEIDSKFTELVWRERNRLMQAMANTSPGFRWARVTGPHLRALDRYLNVQPWHNNRIKLQVPDGHVDYINASPIVLTPSPLVTTADGRPREPDRYIAMQGPKQISTDHVWRMVVEQLASPAVIVMLTETHEGPMEKCFPYFPRSKDDPPLEVNERDEFGDGFRATVRCEGVEETPAGDAIELRKLIIRVHSPPRRGTRIEPASAGSAPTEEAEKEAERDADADVTMADPSPPPLQSPPPSSTTNPQPSPDDTKPPSFSRPTPSAPPPPPPPHSSTDTTPDADADERVVYHFLYKKWPDFGVPALADLGSFFALMQLSRARNASPANPRVVHCSAGVGRSGTFIALEHLVRELEAGVLEGWDERFAGGGAGLAGGVEGGGSGSGRSSRDGVGGGGEEQGVGIGEARSGAATPVSVAASARSGTTGTGGSGSGRASPAPGKIPGQGPDLIFDTVNQLREQRRTMVQAETQYLFIYQVMRKLWLDRYGGDGGQGGKKESGGGGGGGGDDDGEPAAKRLEVGPLVE